MKNKLFIALGLLCSISLASCGSKNTIDDKTIIIGSSTAPHAEILKQTKDYINDKGYKLKIVEFDDYIMPNKGVSDGSLDANYFQHLPYLEDYNKENKTDIVSVGKIHVEPLSLYSKNNNLENIKENATIGIPNDNTNGGRALILLSKLGLIEVDSSKGNSITKNDIISNPYNINIVEFQADILPNQLNSLDYAVINGNYALESGILKYIIEGASESLEDFDAYTYANIIACKKGNENSEAITVLMEALRQENIKEFITNKYKGSVIYLD